MTIDPSKAKGGTSSQGTVTLSAAAQAGGMAVTLSSDGPAAAVPDSIMIPSGQTSGTFTVTTTAVSAETDVTITASAGGGTLSATLQVMPSSTDATKAVSLDSLLIQQSVFKGGQNNKGTVTLTGPAPSGGVAVSLASDDSAATVPASITVAEGATSATFTITSKTVISDLTIRITASAGGASRTTLIRLLPPNDIASLTVSAATVEGGDSTTGTVTLTSNAPADGTVVTLDSNNNDAQVPATMTVAAGKKVGTFTIQTRDVSAAIEVRITASVGSDSQSVQIRVVPRRAGIGTATLKLGGRIN